MKTKSICFFCIFLLLSLLTPLLTSRRVFAEENQFGYMRVVDSNTPFYQDNLGNNLLFYLPKTYFVNVLGKDGDFFHVECYGSGNTPLLDGYVPISNLQEFNSFVESPFLSLTVSTASSCILYKNSTLTEQSQYVFENRTLHYYGVLPVDGGENLIFVFYNGKIGYVKESCLYPFSVPNHPEPINPSTSINNLEQIAPPTSNDTSFNGIKIAIIICLGLAGIVALGFALKKKNRRSQAAATFLDDNDYEQL